MNHNRLSLSSILALSLSVAACNSDQANSPYKLICASELDQFYAEVDENKKIIQILTNPNVCGQSVNIQIGHRPGFWRATYSGDDLDFKCAIEWNRNTSVLAFYAWNARSDSIDTRPLVLIESFVGSCRETEIDFKYLE